MSGADRNRQLYYRISLVRSLQQLEWHTRIFQDSDLLLLSHSHLSHLDICCIHTLRPPARDKGAIALEQSLLHDCMLPMLFLAVLARFRIAPVQAEASSFSPAGSFRLPFRTFACLLNSLLVAY